MCLFTILSASGVKYSTTTSFERGDVDRPSSLDWNPTPPPPTARWFLSLDLQFYTHCIFLKPFRVLVSFKWNICLELLEKKKKNHLYKGCLAPSLRAVF